MEKNEERGLVITPTVGLPIPVERAVEEWRQYQELCKRLLSAEDYQKVGDREFRKKSGWRKLGKAFNVSDEIIDREFQRDDLGRIVYAEFTVQATAPNGRTSIGWGSCSVWERGHEENKSVQIGGRWITCKGPCDGRAHFSKPEHDIPATAHTRAKNRAIADLIGAGEVSYEEMEGGSQVEEQSYEADQQPSPKVETPKVETAGARELPGDYIMPFGMHRDKALKIIPRNYLEWFLSDKGNAPAMRQKYPKAIGPVEAYLGGRQKTLQEEAEEIRAARQPRLADEESPPLTDEDEIPY